LKLGTKLTLYLSLTIITVLSGYGYFHIMTRRDILIRKVKVEVRSAGRTLKVSLERIILPREMEYVKVIDIELPPLRERKEDLSLLKES
jgi:hypothetical protein